MYCKKCGTEIGDDWIFCTKCGTRIAEEDSAVAEGTTPESKGTTPEDTSMKPRGESMEAEEERSGCLFAFITFIIAALILCVVCLVVWGASGAGSAGSSSAGGTGHGNGGIVQIIKRDARNSDIEISDEIDLASLSVSLVIDPSCDIDDLELTLRYYDKNGSLLKTQVERIGDVKKGKKETLRISITEFSLTELFKVDTTEIGVTGGSVSVFQ